MNSIPPERWFRPTAGILGSAAALLILRWLGGNSPTISGAVVFVSATMAVVLIVLWGRAERRQPIHAVAYWLVPVAAVATLTLGIDTQYIRENGIIINTAAVVALVIGGLLARFRT